MEFFLQILISGLLGGLMYSLVAIGYVLIYKASGVFNFAQGAMVLGAALTFVGLNGMGIGFFLSLGFTLLVMILLGVVIERTVLRFLTYASMITVFMATFGISAFIEGAAQLSWGAHARSLDLGIPDIPIKIIEGVTVGQFDIFAAVIAVCLLAILGTFFSKTRVGLQLRAIADGYVPAISLGVNMTMMLALVWATAGIVSVVAGLIWGSRLVVQFTLGYVAMKALPVCMIGGFTSIKGTIVGGLIVGAAESLGEVYIGSIIGSGIQNWVAYAIALIVILFRPYGLYGEKTVERV